MNRNRKIAVAGYYVHIALVIALLLFSKVAADVAWRRMHSDPSYYPGMGGWESINICIDYLFGLFVFVYFPAVLVVAVAVAFGFMNKGNDFSRQLRGRSFLITGWTFGLFTLAYTIFILYDTYMGAGM